MGLLFWKKIIVPHGRSRQRQHGPQWRAGSTANNRPRKNKDARCENVAQGVHTARRACKLSKQVPVLAMSIWETVVAVHTSKAFEGLWQAPIQAAATTGAMLTTSSHFLFDCSEVSMMHTREVVVVVMPIRSLYTMLTVA